MVAVAPGAVADRSLNYPNNLRRPASHAPSDAGRLRLSEPWSLRASLPAPSRDASDQGATNQRANDEESDAH